MNKDLTEYVLYLKDGSVKTVQADHIRETIQKSGVSLQHVLSYSKYVNGKKIISKEPIIIPVNPTVFKINKGIDDIINEYKKRQGNLTVIRSNIPPFSGRPKRDKVISKDDITNISIALNSAKSLKELLTII